MEQTGGYMSEASDHIFEYTLYVEEALLHTSQSRLNVIVENASRSVFCSYMVTVQNCTLGMWVGTEVGTV